MNELLLVPYPRRYSRITGSYKVSEELEEWIHGYRLGSPLINEINHRTVGGRMHPDGFRITIECRGVSVESRREVGLFYALQLLKQLLRHYPDGEIPCARIEDWPDNSIRSVMLDVSRTRVPTMETLFELVDLWAEWRYNELQLYVEHTFAYSRHRKVWQDSSPLTPDEVVRLSRYCRERGITLTPNQNSLGHMERWLCHDDYKHLAECPEGFVDPWGVFRPASSTISPVLPEIPDFMAELYDELLPCFEGEYLNIGGDEPYELGSGRSSSVREQLGIDGLYLEYLLKLHRIAAARGRKLQVYGDIIAQHPAILKKLPKEMVVLAWGYEDAHPFEEEVSRLSRAKIPFYICTGTSAWNSIGGRWENARANIENGARMASRYSASGFMITEWGDNGHWQQFPVPLVGFLFGACASWNLEEASRFDPVTYVATHLFSGSTATAEGYMKLQEVWAVSGVHLHNGSLPAFLLLDPLFPYYREEFKQFKGYTFEGELSLIQQAIELIEGDTSDVDPGVKEELLFTAKLLRHGCQLGAAQLSTPDLIVAGIPEARRTELANELEPLIDDYRRLWVRRSRPGGLAESAGRLEALRNSYTESL